MKRRERLIVFILGAQGSGKSTLALELMRAAERRHEIVACLDPNGKLPRSSMPLDAETWLSERLPTPDPRNGHMLPAVKPATFLVFDDADRYIPKCPKVNSRWQQVALTNRHANVDVIVTGRRLQAFPDSMISGIDFLYLFQLSKADVNAATRLSLVAPDVNTPTEKYEFIRIEPKTATGNAVTGRTLRGGGFELDE